MRHINHLRKISEKSRSFSWLAGISAEHCFQNNSRRKKRAGTAILAPDSNHTSTNMARCNARHRILAKARSTTRIRHIRARIALFFGAAPFPASRIRRDAALEFALTLRASYTLSVDSLRPDPMRYSRHLRLEELQQPLSAEVSRVKCIQSADAFYTFAAGEGDAQTVSHLLSVVYTAYFIDDMMEERDFPLDMFRVAETALRECQVSGERSGKFDIPVAQQIEIQQVLILYIHHLAHAPIFVHVYATERAAEFLSPGSASPIPGEPKQQPMH